MAVRAGKAEMTRVYYLRKIGYYTVRVTAIITSGYTVEDSEAMFE